VFSPHAENIVASCSYDMTVRLWDVASPTNPLMQTWGHHTEFAVGLEFNVHIDGQLASAGWDESVAIWDCRQVGSM
jgi:peroxin-7